MVRNDYRRALILLRAMQSGYSGHVRLELRTTMGSLQFTVTGLGGQAGQAFAVLAARMEDGWKTVRIGCLQHGAGRQAGLRWTFDPRNIEGLPLDSYQIVAVAIEDAAGCRVLLFGFLDSVVSFEPGELELAVCGSSCPYPEPSADAPKQDASPSGETSPAQTPSAQAPSPEPTAPAQDDPLMSAPAQDVPSAEEIPSAEDDPLMSAPAADPDDDALDAPSAPAEDRPPTAMSLLGLDPDRRWPESIEPLRALFAASEPFVPFEEDGYVFVRADPAGDCPQCAVGILASGGVPAAVAYAIPAGSETEPPAGLEGYERRGDWWAIFADADTGSILERTGQH